MYALAKHLKLTCSMTHGVLSSTSGFAIVTIVTTIIIMIIIAIIISSNFSC